MDSGTGKVSFKILIRGNKGFASVCDPDNILTYLQLCLEQRDVALLIVELIRTDGREGGRRRVETPAPLDMITVKGIVSRGERGAGGM
jgi:hypothetical protein